MWPVPWGLSSEGHRPSCPLGSRRTRMSRAPTEGSGGRGSAIWSTPTSAPLGRGGGHPRAHLWEGRGCLRLPRQAIETMSSGSGVLSPLSLPGLSPHLSPKPCWPLEEREVQAGAGRGVFSSWHKAGPCGRSMAVRGQNMRMSRPTEAGPSASQAALPGWGALETAGAWHFVGLSPGSAPFPVGIPILRGSEESAWGALVQQV